MIFTEINVDKIINAFTKILCKRSKRLSHLDARTKVLLKVLLVSPVPLNVMRPDPRSTVKRPLVDTILSSTRK